MLAALGVDHGEIRVHLQTVPQDDNELEALMDYWEDLRETMRGDRQLARAVDSYVIKKDDVKQHNDSVAFLANMTPGPYVIKTPHAGYGLVADRRYQPNEIVTVYAFPGEGGEAESGDYVVQVGKTATIDGRWGVPLARKGRFVNEDRIDKTRANTVELGVAKGGAIAFKAKQRVFRGTHLLWFYGNEYDREEPVQSAERKRSLRDLRDQRDAYQAGQFKRLKESGRNDSALVVVQCKAYPMLVCDGCNSPFRALNNETVLGCVKCTRTHYCSSACGMDHLQRIHHPGICKRLPQKR